MRAIPVIIDWHLGLHAVEKHWLDRLASDCQGIVRASYCDVYRCACTSELCLNSLSLLSCAGPELSHSMLSYTLDLSCLTPSSPVDLRSLTPFSTSLVLCSPNHSPPALDLISYDTLHSALSHARPTIHCIPLVIIVTITLPRSHGRLATVYTARKVRVPQ